MLHCPEFASDFIGGREYKAAMSFSDFPEQKQAVELLQRSLNRGRLGHAYLFNGHELPALEALARTLAKTLNCQKPARQSPEGPAIDCCDQCLSCRKIGEDNHADIHWVRPESKSRQITIDQMRDVMREINLKPSEGEYKVAVVTAADRMNTAASNAFLKTLEEPPAKCVMILLTTESQRLLETIVSRCLRLNFSAEGAWRPSPEHARWLTDFGEVAAGGEKSLIGRYRLLSVLLQQLGQLKEQTENALTAKSPLQKYDDVEPELRKRWEDELAAAVEAEYRRQRTDLLAALQWWLRDVWLRAMQVDSALLSFPQAPAAGKIAARLSPEKARDNLGILERTQRLLNSNVQEALALEVGLLKLNL